MACRELGRGNRFFPTRAVRKFMQCHHVASPLQETTKCRMIAAMMQHRRMVPPPFRRPEAYAEQAGSERKSGERRSEGCTSTTTMAVTVSHAMASQLRRSHRPPSLVHSKYSSRKADASHSCDQADIDGIRRPCLQETQHSFAAQQVQQQEGRRVSQLRDSSHNKILNSLQILCPGSDLMSIMCAAAGCL